MDVLIVNAVEWGPTHPDDGFPRDVGDWIKGAMEPAEEPPPRFTIWRAQGQAPPEREHFDAVIMSGSAGSVYDDETWIGRLEDRVRRWAELETPILGICFGHQVIAQALGGRVEKNPLGWEVGTQKVMLTPEGTSDPLFAGLPSPLKVMESHQDIVVEPPPGAICLAGNDISQFQSLAIGDRIRTVQFHPEYTVEQIRYLLNPRREMLTDQGVDFEAEMGSICETPGCRTLIDRFIRGFALSNAEPRS